MDQDFQTKDCGGSAPSQCAGQRPRFFPEGPQHLREELDEYLRWLGERAGAIPGLKGFFLSGGYGRGEGGIFKQGANGRAGLYNDLEFYVFAPFVGKGVVEGWVHEGERRFGIEVEFKVLPPGALEHGEPSMFFYDLLQANEFVAGDCDWVASLREELSQSAKIPIVEASRLLINRGMSLLRCMRWACGERELPVDFCARIAAKAKLALADAVLVANQKYHWSCLERHRCLAGISRTPPSWASLVDWHADAVEFKFHPVIAECQAADWVEALQELMGTWVEVFLWVEGERCGRHFDDAASYARDRARLFPGEPTVRNVLRQVRDLRHTPRVPFQWGDHPRAAIWRAAVVLMSLPAHESKSKEQVSVAMKLLGISGEISTTQVEETLRSCWQRYP